MPIPAGPRPAHAPEHPLTEVAARLGLAVPTGGRPEPDVVRVTGLTLNSRAVRPGDLYAALPGKRAHGADFVASARAAGAVAVLTDRAGRQRIDPSEVPVLVVDDPRACLGDLAAWLYGHPAAALLTLGVTGTNGKTTTTFLLDSALRRLGRSTGLIGTIHIRIAEERITSIATTPEAPDVQALLAVMRERGVAACSMEVSSHALAQHRVDGVRFDVAGFTNLSQDHLDYHHTMADYFEAKARLFTPEHCRSAVICVDDHWGTAMAARAVQAGVPVVTVSARSQPQPQRQADWWVRDRGVHDGLPTATVTGPAGRSVLLRSPLPGEFNLANCLLALVMITEVGIDADTAAAALADADPVPGRMERVRGGGVSGEPLALVDYAHTPAAVRVALAALRGSGSPTVIVLGAGGDRDRDKRPLMGAAAAAGADIVIVTDDNPRSEDPGLIRAAVLAGARAQAAVSGALVIAVGNRRQAIAEGIRRAWEGGVVLVAGKGHEQGQDVGSVVHPFDDRTVLHEALVARGVLVPTDDGVIL